MATTVYGDITPRTAGKASKHLQRRAAPMLCLETFGQAQPLKEKESKSIIFRRYEALAPAKTPLTEGVTPAGQKLTKTDVTATLQQYGDYVEITDVIQDTHEDPVLQEMMALCGEQAALTLEMVRYGVVKAGTNRILANGAARNEVNTAYSLTLQRKATNLLKRQNAQRITQVVEATDKFNTMPIAASFIGLAHVDMETSIRGFAGFTPTEQYSSSMKALPGEIGKVEDVRYILSTVFEPWVDAGGAKGAMISTTGTSADVYPVLIVSRDAYGVVPFKGKNSVTPMVLNPNSPRGGDPLGQRGTVGWKTMHTAVILNDFWMVRVECAVPAL
jgi:N4-gp56 family major capsid protein